MGNKKIILGSASPRRRELLAQIGAEFEIRVSEKEEIYHSEKPEEIVCELALMKAENVASELSEAERAGDVVLGADTVVVLDGKILGKPSDEEEAARMLSALQGRSHEVYTGVAVLEYAESGEGAVPGGWKLEKKENYAVETRVYVNPMTEQEILEYIVTGDPMDKAGAYGIQGRFAAYIDRIEGDYYNVVGLPVSRVYRTLKEMKAL
ncbi:MAG TPA: septum formation protein Maf [Candidatus Mediterraneibacter excrementigallinarum]|nr:septum formation protein Maf [Candidatus Mediterraneibacter excrementigallinarum]